MKTIRKMKNEDLIKYSRLSSICYTYTDDRQPDPLSDELLQIRMGVFDEEDQLVSAMMQIPYQVRFAGETVKLIGVGGVVTDPASRGERGVRSLFEEGLPRLYQEGAVFSALYPFSHRFYAKFGYEWAEFSRNVEIPRSSLRRDLHRADQIVRVLPDDADDQGMRQIYEAYIIDKHLAVIRDDWMWKELRKGTPWATMKHAYVLKIAGRPVAYWIGMMEKQQYGGVLKMKDMAWTCPEGLEAIFAMIRGMNEVSAICVRTQSGFEPRCLVEEPYDVAERGVGTGMVRIMNVMRALALLTPPPLPGQVTIEVTDEQIPDNCGRFTVAGDGYVLTVTRDDSAVPDLRASINGLAALVTGRHDFDTAVGYRAAEIVSGKNLRFAARLFTARKLHMNQDF